MASPHNYTMARNGTPKFQREVQNLQIGPDHDQISSLESYIETLNLNEIPHFLSNLSPNSKNPENLSQNEKLSILDQLVRTQGPKITPFISPIVTTLIQIISFNHNHSSYFLLHETCSNLISSISRFGIDPLASENDKIRVLTSLIIPLSDQLMSSSETTSSICAFGIKALVETDNWKLAPRELVDQICSKLVGSLSTKSHLDLVISLSTLNPLVIESYSSSIIRSGLNIFTTSESPQMKLISIEMINSLMKFIDSRAISSEIGNIIRTLQHCQIKSVTVFDALEMARSKLELQNCSSPVFGLILENEQCFKQVNGFGSAMRYSLDELEECGTGEETGCCMIHEKCNKCSSSQRHGKTNLKKISPNLGSNLKLENPNKDSNSESRKRSPNQNCLSCKVCHQENKKEITSEKWRWNKTFGLCLILGVIVVIFSVFLRVWLVDLDEDVYLVPT